MTPGERVDPKLINASRKRRIAAGAGTSQQEVSGLLRQFGQAQKMMQSFSQGKGMPGIPNIPGMPKNAIPGGLPGGKPLKLKGAPAPRTSAKQPRTAKKSQKKKKA